MVHRQELVKQIRETFAADEIDPRHTTIMTVGKIVHRMDKLPRPTLIITDETHHSLAKTYRTIYEHYFGVARLGFSASPWRMSGQGLGDVYDTMVEGPSVAWLIENHYLAPFDYYAPTGIDISALKKSSTGDFSKKSMDDAIGKTIFGDVVQHYKRLANGRQAIVYAHSVDASKSVVDAFQSAGISAAHADAKTPTAERSRIMQAFKTGELTILSNVDLISEGFNVPDCGVVILLRPTASLVLDIQQSMRGMRYQPGKRSIIIDHVANCYRFGVPDTPREWSLDGRAKKKHAQDDAPAIKTCPACFGVIPARSRACPLCGTEIPIESSEMEQREAELKKVTAATFAIKVKYHEPEMKLEDAKSYADLQTIAKQRGYKPGWVYFQAKAKGFIKKRA